MPVARVKPESNIFREELKPFVFDGFVSVDGTELHPIIIFRDMLFSRIMVRMCVTYLICE